MRLLAGHPGASIAFATAESSAGEVLEGQRLLKADDAPLQRAELVFSCLPHGVSRRYVQAARAAGRRAVDLSADFRLSPEAVYGLTEVTRPRVAGADLVANPGCYPTAALLALIPLAQQGLIDPAREVVIDAASGVTGAGRSPKRELLFGEVTENFHAYAVGNTHRHLPELRDTLAREGGFTGDLLFTPHLLPVKRGILETIHVPLTRALDRAAAEDLYGEAYAGEPCVQLMRGCAALAPGRGVPESSGDRCGAGDQRATAAPHGHRGHRQPRQGRGGAGGAEHERDARNPRDTGARVLGPRVAKLGGNELDRPGWLEECARALKACRSTCGGARGRAGDQRLVAAPRPARREARR